MSEHMSPIPSRVYNAAVGGHVCGPEDVDFGQKVVHLIKYDRAGNEVSFESQVTQANKIYVIHDDFVLSSNMTIPDNCVLKFDGGSLSGNHTLTLNKTYIQGNAKFDVTLAGDVSNEVFNVLWMKGNDIGEQINKAGVNFKSLIIPQGNYTFTIPVVVENISVLEAAGAVLKFNGEYKNCEGIFIIKNSSSCYVNFGKLEPYNLSTINHSGDRTINCIGLEVRSCNNSYFIINDIGWFNENLRVSDRNNGYGCCYNTFKINSLKGGNANLRIYQQNKDDGGIGWCNANTFNGGRYWHPSNGYTYDYKYDIIIGGPALDSANYLPSGVVDTYDSIDCITIQDASMEKPWTPILARNVIGLSLLRIDGEQNPNAAKFIGIVSDLEINAIYGPGIWSCDYSEVTKLTVKHGMYCSEVIDINANRNRINGNYIPYNFDMTNGNGVLTFPYMDTYLSLGRVIDTSSIKLFSLQTNKAGRFSIRYLDDNGNNITQNYTNKSPLAFFYYNSNGKEWISSADTTGESVIIIPSEITKIFIGVTANNKSDELIISSTNGFSFKTKIISGTTAQRPSSGMPSNISYFDTDLNKPIWYDGNSTTGWVDATGTPV